MITKNQTKNRTSLNRLFLSLMTCFMFLMGMWTNESLAQVSYSNDFNANATGWTGTITRTTATTACGTASMRRNLYSSVTIGNMVTPSMAGNNGGTVTVSYKYKAANYSANTVGTNPWGYFNVQYSTTSATGHGQHLLPLTKRHRMVVVFQNHIHLTHLQVQIYG